MIGVLNHIDSPTVYIYKKKNTENLTNFVNVEFKTSTNEDILSTQISTIGVKVLGYSEVTFFPS